MSVSTASGFQHEWITLQTQYDSYEKYSLLIKLLNVTLTCLLLFVFHVGIWSLPVIAIIWLQDGIWKTFQNRIATRLYVVEKALANGPNDQSMQFNTAWLEARSSVSALLKEYIGQSCNPTVAYPHVVLLAMSLVFIYVA
ncbi:MAG: hypothetical protein ACI88A_005128 [Paraglaciecola sp.]|jgi:hypothetical protein